jgi:hypothetical protein
MTDIRTTGAICRVTRQLSPALTVLAGALLAAGPAVGLADYLNRSAVPARFVPGSSAWWQHGAVAVTGAVLMTVAWRRRRTPPGRLWLLAPIGRAAARRVAATVRDCGGRRAALGRLALALPPAALFLYGPFRAARQVTGGLDPNATVNAWGGPGYAGALACHWLDIFLLMAAAAWLLDKILVPDPAAAGGPAGRDRPRGRDLADQGGQAGLVHEVGRADGAGLADVVERGPDLADRHPGQDGPGQPAGG